MAPDPERVKQVRAWIENAKEDLRAVEVDLKADPPLVGAAGFHVQQAAEKAMKGFLAWHDRPFGKTHDLVVLANACLAVDRSLESFVPEVSPLTEYIWRSRYPGRVADELGIEEVREGEAVARRLYAAILQRLPPEVRVS